VRRIRQNGQAFSGHSRSIPVSIFLSATEQFKEPHGMRRTHGDRIAKDQQKRAFYRGDLGAPVVVFAEQFTEFPALRFPNSQIRDKMDSKRYRTLLISLQR
jgi:hypothetical protein